MSIFSKKVEGINKLFPPRIVGKSKVKYQKNEEEEEARVSD